MSLLVELAAQKHTTRVSRSTASTRFFIGVQATAAGVIRLTLVKGVRALFFPELEPQPAAVD